MMQNLKSHANFFCVCFSACRKKFMSLRFYNSQRNRQNAVAKTFSSTAELESFQLIMITFCSRYFSLLFCLLNSSQFSLLFQTLNGYFQFSSVICFTQGPNIVPNTISMETLFEPRTQRRTKKVNFVIVNIFIETSVTMIFVNQ